MIVVSSCLVGKKCRYNGGHSLNQALLDSLGEEYIDLCPEILGGLETPRNPCEIIGGEGKDVLKGTARIVDCNGADVTDKMVLGAERALEICKVHKVTKAYLKQGSPSCGFGWIYDGSFSSVARKGNGVFAELLVRSGVEVVEV